MDSIKSQENLSKTAKVILQLIESHGLSINDFRSCLELSKEIRDSIFQSVNIMARIKVNADYRIKNKEEFFQFLSSKGNFIQNLDLQMSFTLTELKEQVLRKVPNLKSLYCNFYFSSDANMPTEQPIELQYLTHLTFECRDFKYFEIIAKNIETLKFDNYKSEDEEVITNILCQQESLKKLRLYYSKTFPTRDISHQIKFQLTKFSYFSYQDGINENFMKFLDTQAEHLKELKLLSTYEPKYYESFLRKCKNLEKLDINGSISSNGSQRWRLESVKSLSVRRIDDVAFNFIWKKFPNLEELKLYAINDSTLMKLISRLKILKNLQTFKARCNCNSSIEFDINFLEKTIDVNAEALSDWKESSDILRENFNHFNYESLVFELFDEIV